MATLQKIMTQKYQNYNYLPKQERANLVLTHIGLAEVKEIITSQLDVDLLKKTYEAGNTEFNEDTPYPNETWVELAGFVENDNHFLPVDSKLRVLLNNAGIKGHSITEGVMLLKTATKNILTLTN